MIIINTGNGKGKTTSAIGQIVRYLGQGFKICLIYLFKSEHCCGENNILSKLNNIDILYFVNQHPYFNTNIHTSDIILECNLALSKLKEFVNSNHRYDVFVLDEFNIALKDKFINEKNFISVVQLLSKQSDIIITGRGATQKLLDLADLVTDMIDVKHPYSHGILAKKGLEF
ncbi:MAG: cob(I)yrinic acid a,c-diamide adenosyltransferase [Endomicrobium sp.]|jgi:cob(I)alamin adenosyltransferase|nr:cob(I)yrinic acid a,c-diamide adenosyltransferase [Endomicrobium sp.]